MKKNRVLLVLLSLFILPQLVFGASDDFAVPFKDLIVAWMQGNVGLTIAIIIMVISVVWRAFGGGFGVIGKGFVLSVLVGGVIYFADQAFSLGTAFA